MSKTLNPEDIVNILKKDVDTLSNEEKLELHTFTIATIATDMKLVLESINQLDSRLKLIETKLKE